MTNLQRFVLLLHCSTVFLSLVQPVHGFAAWLKCYVDLTDDEEIIMNNRIIPAKDAPLDVRIQVKFAQDDEWLSSLSYPPDRTTSTVMLRLQVPPELSHEDVQYVMETTTNPGARFLRPQPTCEGRRSHASHYAIASVLEIDGTTETVEIVAGYAKSHEAVTLTPRLILQRQQQQQSSDASQKEL
jgi:hypothetical protein